MKHRILFLVSLAICGLFSSSSTCAQTVELPALVSGQELESIKGSTVNRSNTTGGSSSLTVGSRRRSVPALISMLPQVRNRVPLQV